MSVGERLERAYYTIGDKIFKRLSDSSIVSMAVCTDAATAEFIAGELEAMATFRSSVSETDCICGEINARHCPVHNEEARP